MVRKKRFLNLSQPHSLHKPGVRQTKPPSLIDMNRPPTTRDYDGFQNGDEWIDRSSKVGVVPPAHDVYKLVDKTKQIATWVKLGAGSAELLTLTGDDLIGVPSTANNINIIGGTSARTTGNPGTSTITVNVDNPVTGWVPVLDFGGDTTGITYSEQIGSYSQVGDVVTFSLSVQLTSIGAFKAGSMEITGIPFVAATRTPVSLVQLYLSAYGGSLQAYIDGAGFYAQGAVAGELFPTQINYVNFHNTSGLQMAGVFFV